MEDDGARDEPCAISANGFCSFLMMFIGMFLRNRLFDAEGAPRFPENRIS
jgi:hypothetical protein